MDLTGFTITVEWWLLLTRWSMVSEVPQNQSAMYNLASFDNYKIAGKMFRVHYTPRK